MWWWPTIDKYGFINMWFISRMAKSCLSFFLKKRGVFQSDVFFLLVFAKWDPRAVFKEMHVDPTALEFLTECHFRWQPTWFQIENLEFLHSIAFLNITRLFYKLLVFGVWRRRGTVLKFSLSDFFNRDNRPCQQADFSRISLP